MKKKKMLVWILLLVLLLTIVYFGRQALLIMTSYTAKYACSSIYIADAQKDRLDIDLGFFPINLVNYIHDVESKSVKASLLGMSQTAYFYQRGSFCGCSFEPVESSELAESEKQTKQKTDSLAWPLGNGGIQTTDTSILYDRLDLHLRSMMDSFPATLAIVVACDGKLVGESYGEGVNSEKALLGWSMTKSMSNALMGILVKKGVIALDEKNLIPEWKNDERSDISLHHLLRMNSGLKFSEDYFMISDVTRMLYMRPSTYDYAISVRAEKAPGEKWNYSSGTSNILSGILRHRLADDQAYLEFPQKELFDKLGMNSALIEMDAAGNYVFSSYGWATARDWTRFGQLYIQDGVWDGERILPEGWVEWSTSAAEASDNSYGAQIWLNSGKNKIPSVPDDAYFENGFGGQRVLVIPSKNMVITVLSGMQLNFDFDKLYEGIFEAAGR